MSRIITFYSYKGGTGRSMALANVAWVLASNGKRVLAIDWDLEAPGLHRYFQPFLTDKELIGQESQGVIDMAIDFAVRAATPLKEGETLDGTWYEAHADFSKWRQKLRWSSGETVRLGRFRKGEIDFVSAGRQGPDYAKRVNNFDWRSFYEKLDGGAFFDEVKRKFVSYDYVLIDSRTGVSDTSGICTVHMPDTLVVCFTLNYQSIKGASAVAQSVREQRPNMRIFPVPMRIDASEEKLLNRMKNYAADVFTPFLDSEINVKEYWYSMEVPYFSRYAYAEKLALFEERGSITASTLPSMERLTEYLTAGDVRTSGALPESERLLARAEFEGVPFAPIEKPALKRAEAGIDVFISYSRADSRRAAEIDSMLRGAGLTTFFDHRDLNPGLLWVRALEESMDAAKTVLILIGQYGLGNTQQYERDLAIVRQSRDPTFRIVPVILSESTAGRPFDFLQLYTWIDFSTVGRLSDAPDELERLLEAVRGGLKNQKLRETLCPWRGFEAFREEDSTFFFGRGSPNDPQSPVGRLVLNVREHQFVMVVGRSGSGKSSLVFAGLIPALRRDRDRFWHVISLRPGPNPLLALASAFNRRGEDEGANAYATRITKEADGLRTGGSELLSDMIRQELDRADGKPDQLLLYIDQWEELYALAFSLSAEKDRAVRHSADVNRFIDLLLNAAQSAPVSVVATVRADFYDPLITNQKIRALLPTHQVLLGSMSRSELESTIVEPAKKVGLAFDPPNLVQRILDDAGEDEGALPLLQYALVESWKQRSGNVITADCYARSGGVQGAIWSTAERTFEALSAEEKGAARQLFLRLVVPGEGQENIRVRAVIPSEPMLRKIVDQFASSGTRLLVTGWDRGERPTVEIAHEALIRRWPRLREWIDANREKLRARAAVLQAELQWEQHGRRDDLLLPAGFQLERARALVADPGDINTEDIIEYISLSSAQEESVKARIAAMREAQTRRVRRTRQAAFAGVAAILIAAATFAWIKSKELTIKQAELNHARANFFGELSQARRMAGDIDSALRLASYGTRIDLKLPSYEINASLATAALAAAVSQADWRLVLDAHDGPLSSAAFSPDATRIVTASFDNTARIWDADTGNELTVLNGHESTVRSAAYSPDGRRIVTGSWDKTARVWDAENGAELLVLIGHDSLVSSAAFSPDGKRIVTASFDNTARIWDAASAQQIMVLRGHLNKVNSAAFSPDGLRVVTASEDKTARVWDAENGNAITILRSDDPVNSAAFSPDAARIVTASSDKTARIWDARTGMEIAVLRGHEAPVNNATFSPDGVRIGTASEDKTARIWDAVTAREIAVLRGHNDPVNSVAFGRGGALLVTASVDQTARVWTATIAREILILRGDGPVRSATFSPDGSRIASGSDDKTARIWDVRSAKELLILRGHEDLVNSVAFSLDGSRVVTGSGDNTARVWDAVSGRQISVLKNDDPVNSAAFSPDGSRIVTALWDNTARVWDASTSEEIAVLRSNRPVNSAAFSPDGSRIVTASNDRVVRVWDAASRKEILELRGHDSTVNSAAFSPDGSRIVTGSDDKSARVWDVASGKEITLLRSNAPVNGAAFSPDASRIVTASSDNTARIWDAGAATEIAILRGHEGPVTSAAFSPDGSRIVTASIDKTTRIWDAQVAIMPVTRLLEEACARLGNMRRLTSQEMRLVFLDNESDIDVCQ